MKLTKISIFDTLTKVSHAQCCVTEHELMAKDTVFAAGVCRAMTKKGEKRGKGEEEERGRKKKSEKRKKRPSTVVRVARLAAERAVDTAT